MRKFFYTGDINIVHGGMWYALDTWKWGYVECVRVTPCSDAGGPDNCWWVDTLTINVERPKDQIQMALDCIGYDSAEMREDFTKRTPSERRHIITYACVSYGYYDTHDSQMVRIGPQQPSNPSNGEFNPTVKLRGNASLDRYVREKVRAMK